MKHKRKKSIFKKWWLWVIISIVIYLVIGGILSSMYSIKAIPAQGIMYVTMWPFQILNIISINSLSPEEKFCEQYGTYTGAGDFIAGGQCNVYVRPTCNFNIIACAPPQQQLVNARQFYCKCNSQNKCSNIETEQSANALGIDCSKIEHLVY